MPSPQACLTLLDVRDHVHSHVFGTAASDEAVGDARARRSVGIELEWLTSYRDPHTRLTQDQAEALMADVTPLPGGSRLTLEPGGQLELSSARFDSIEDATAAMATDLFVLDQACASRRIELIALGADPLRSPTRILDAPRYAAMESYFDHDSWAGRTMMCNTASIQLNIGLGDPRDTVERWLLAHALGPTLIACFANSPFANGAPSGWQSTRLRSWWTLDPTRASPPALHGDPIERWIEYALDARVMLVRSGPDEHHPITEPLTFGAWLARGHELGWPTIDDFAYHLTTLFPPVRPRGWYELRVIDALPTPFWNVAVAVTHRLLDDPACAEPARRAVAGTEHLWVDAAQLGLAHPALNRAARDLFELALQSFAHSSPESAFLDVVSGYHDRWVARGRTPADDRLDAWRRCGTLSPPRESPVPYIREYLAEIDVR
jgi:glutamate--cysteine ligase